MNIDSYGFTSPSKEQAQIISFEGIEACGKTTQINNFTQYLKSLGKKVTLFREPGTTTFGEKLREALLQSESDISPLAQAYLFASSRAQLHYEKISPLLNNKENVILIDRYIDSSIAYQGFAGSLGVDTILNIHNVSPLNILPNQTFYLAIDIDTSMRRQLHRGNQKDFFEKKKKDFYLRLIDGYEETFKLFPKRVTKIDATLSEQQVFDSLKANYANK